MSIALHTDRPLLGILLMAAFCVLAPFADAMAKLPGNTVPVIQIITFRFAIQLIALGVLGTLAHLIMTLSLQYAPTATLANGLAAIGILITIAAGLYIVMRERRIAQTV